MLVHEVRDALMQEWRDSSSASFRDEFVVRTCTEAYCMVMSIGDLGASVDEIIEREIAVHREMGRSFEWCLFSSDLPHDLMHRLQDHGFVASTKEVICAYDLATGMPPVDSGIRVERVLGEAGLADFRLVAEAVFQKDYSFTAGELARSLAAGNHMVTGFVAYDGAVPVCAGRLTMTPDSDFAGLYSGGTLPEYRGQGFYRALVWARARYAEELGAKFVTVDAQPTSLPILRLLGFEELVESWPCIWGLN